MLPALPDAEPPADPAVAEPPVPVAPVLEPLDPDADEPEPLPIVAFARMKSRQMLWTRSFPQSLTRCWMRRTRCPTAGNPSR